jgi:hypothetical protein
MHIERPLHSRIREQRDRRLAVPIEGFDSRNLMQVATLLIEYAE